MQTTYPTPEYWSTPSVRAASMSPVRSRSSTWDSVYSLDSQRLSLSNFEENEKMNHVMRIETPKDWCRGQAANVNWTILDPTFQPAVLRIEVCNTAWDVPTTIAEHAPNTGMYEWKRVHWGMPIQGDYFIKMYAISELGVLELVAQSLMFAIVQ
ncbi:hypothetical protein THRCLA_21242 [Thraustotheca clavata]|uniref:Uncharacterized protein n=1 Tax=Thraustotheca clavata TaxID=74557 RepID=A0A1V9ZYJ8_9STRA|nr:hypothetical protein THRCLA_21242 [Thraustotheca clavata]